jgi:casein kinase I homolog HRR25
MDIHRALWLGTQLILKTAQISHIACVHSSHFIHCDIKPANSLLGVAPHCNDVYIISFGLANKYRDKGTHLHIAFQSHYNILTGTTLYASLNAHRGVEQSRRDDLESLAYVLIYLLCGSLPWYGAKTSTQTQRDRIAKMKLDGLSNFLTELPNEFLMFLDYARALGFEDKPDYTYLRRLFHDLRMREGLQHDNIFNWCLPKTIPTISQDNDEVTQSGSKRMFVQFTSLQVRYLIMTSNRLRSHTRRQNLLCSPVL